MKKTYVFLLLFFTVIFSSCANNLAPSLGSLRAYPNPFNPDLQVITIEPQTAVTLTGSVTLEITDYNGKLIYQSIYTAYPVRWSGFNAIGQRIPAGIYTAKLIQRQIDDTVAVSSIDIVIQ